MDHIAHLRNQFKLIKTSYRWLGEEKPYYFLFENLMVFICKTLSPFYPKMLCAKFGWNWLSGSWEDFSISTLYFCYFIVIYPWKRASGWSFIWRNWNSIKHPRMLCAKLSWNWTSGSREEFFFQISSIYFWYFVIISL